MSRQASIWLVGMMGSGKSTLGPRLAERLGRPFIDTDHEIERRAGRTVAEIFATEGEPAFRRLEREAMERAAASCAVVALGGGAMAQPGVPDWLATRGLSIYLRARVESLLERIGDPETRPLLAGLDPEARRARLEALLAERAPEYEKAAVLFDTDDGADLDSLVDALTERVAHVEGQATGAGSGSGSGS